MTNELLVQLIGQGENDELLPLLWEKMRKYYRLESNNYYNKHIDRCKQFSVTEDDIFQESYFSMLEAIKAFNQRSEKNKDLKFITFTHNHFVTQASALIGLRSSYGRFVHDPLNSISQSLDAEINGTTNDKDTSTLGELLPDDKAFDEADDQFQKSELEFHKQYARRIIKKVLSGSSGRDKEREIIIRHYFNDETLQQIAESKGCSRQAVYCIEKRALDHLRKSKYAAKYILGEYDHRSVNACLRDGSIVEKIVEQREAIQLQRTLLDQIIVSVKSIVEEEQKYHEEKICRRLHEFDEKQCIKARSLDSQIRQLVKLSSSAFIELGRCFNEINITSSFIPLGYESFTLYVKKSLHYSAAQARDYIKIYSTYGEAYLNKYKSIGPDRFSMLTQFSKDFRSKWIESGYVGSLSLKKCQKVIIEVKKKPDMLDELIKAYKEGEGDNEEDE